MVADKGKKPKTEDDQQIDVELVQSIEKLQEVQDELEKVHIWGASGKARLNLNRVSLIRLPVCYGSGGGAPRASTANVRKEINEEASDKVLEIEQKYNVVRKPVYDKRNEIIKSIPDFWPTAFLSHPALANLLTEEDQKGIQNGVKHEKKGKKRSHEDDNESYGDGIGWGSSILGSPILLYFFSWFSGTQKKDDIDDTQDGSC
ncbi:nucleosome assembly protein [Tanacetum coccineum]|uniref:Nucleosome assembly protein n=1 Tax=Tanacetum coccineum TaxID=301880 RepID=A0ABQ5GYS1_9ASTR